MANAGLFLHSYAASSFIRGEWNPQKTREKQIVIHLSKTLHAKAVLLALTLSLCTGLSTARAEMAVYTLDQSQSSLTLSGSVEVGGFGELFMIPQGAGSLTASYTGTITAEVTGSNIDFGTSSLVADNSGSWMPLGDASAGSALANYGGFFFGSVASQPTFGVEIAVRDLAFNLQSGDLPITAGEFAADDVLGSVTMGSSAYRAGTFFTPNNADVIAMTSVASLQNAPLSPAPTMGTISTLNGIETLTIPVNIQNVTLFTDPTTVTGGLVGQIVATRLVPEPASLMMLVSAAGFCFTRRPRRPRN